MQAATAGLRLPMNRVRPTIAIFSHHISSNRETLYHGDPIDKVFPWDADKIVMGQVALQNDATVSHRCGSLGSQRSTF
jgi:hypothetical protein